MLAKYLGSINPFDFSPRSQVSGVCYSILQAAKRLKDAKELSFVHISDTDLYISDLWYSGAWHLQHLFTPLPYSIQNVILLTNPDTNSSREAGWFWSSNSTRIYMVKDAYEWLAERKHTW
ncbi:hypothetical protein PIB30_098888 [Stylosanthes scabra]|uniref:Nucleotide-diphospho-sugar transferase domain-containing protein n=1 Tax=Stylosanthes scabra TaxID=79078 RepID=A0ABU6SX10_9FABA|nr:hypothetical protein [Stylosanthes scabra]